MISDSVALGLVEPTLRKDLTRHACKFVGEGIQELINHGGQFGWSRRICGCLDNYVSEVEPSQKRKRRWTD